MVMADQQTSELPEPCIGSFNDPSAFVAPQFSAIVVPPLLVVVSVRSNQFDAPLLPTLAQGIGVVSAVGDHSLGFLPGPSFAPRDPDFFERGVRKRNFCRRGTFQPNSQRNTLTVSQYHPLCAFATLGFFRLRRLLFGCRETSIEEGFVPSQQTFVIERSKQCSPSP